MGFRCGIVGLQNVGKSTLFNALTATDQAEAANYPFTTIEPNTGRVGVPDSRLERIAGIVRPKNVVPAQLEFVDIAGLVRGASKGEGLGNRFLAHIREGDAIGHVLRCFADDTVPHAEGSVAPSRDPATAATHPLQRRVRQQTRPAHTAGPVPHSYGGAVHSCDNLPRRSRTATRPDTDHLSKFGRPGPSLRTSGMRTPSRRPS